MKKTLFSQEAAYKPYLFKGLHGRYAHFPARSDSGARTFVLVYGQHATLERVRPIADALTEFGDVYMVDTPGFGGMDPSYKVKEYPSLEFLAAHLNHFVTEHIPASRQLTLVGISFGFQILTQALAEYPELAARTEHAVSFVGFVKYTDFSMPASYKVFLLHLAAHPARYKAGSLFFTAALRPGVLRMIFFFNRPFNTKFKDFDKAQAKEYVDQQIWLWMVNDHRTHGATAWDFFKKNDLTGLRLDADAIHIGVPNDHLINNKVVTEELHKMYRHVDVFDLHLPNHAPLDIDSPDKVRALLPDGLVAMMQTSKNAKALVGEAA